MTRPRVLATVRSMCRVAMMVVVWAAIAGCDFGSPPPVPAPTGEPRDGADGASDRYQLTIEPAGDDPTRVVVTAVDQTGWEFAPDDVAQGALQGVLTLYRLDGDDNPDSARPDRTQRPILGTYELSEDSQRVLFRPAFPLQRNQRYAARLTVGEEYIWRTHRVPAPESANRPRLLAIYPTSSVLPANHLKFYIVFSEPMQQGNIFKHFRLENVTMGEDVPRPFRHTELWSGDNRRLTLWFHPGRQKPGVNLNVEIGPVLREGNRYRLHVGPEWQSQQGVPLGEPQVKTFRAGLIDNTQPDPSGWILVAPHADTRDPLWVDLAEPLDWALLGDALSVVDSADKRLDGKVTVSESETLWSFRPERPWQAGTYRLAIRAILEDLAGNSIERPFNVDITTTPPERIGKTVYRQFEVVAAP